MYAFWLFTANKSNSFVCFLRESTARQSCFRFYLTFNFWENCGNSCYSAKLVAHYTYIPGGSSEHTAGLFTKPRLQVRAHTLCTTMAVSLGVHTTVIHSL